MLDFGSTELLLIVVVAVLVLGPKELPRALYKLGQVVGKGKAMARHFRSGLDAMVREAELEDLQKQWDKQNSSIMAEHPPTTELAAEMMPLADETAGLYPETPALAAGTEAAGGEASEAADADGLGDPDGSAADGAGQGSLGEDGLSKDSLSKDRAAS